MRRSDVFFLGTISSVVIFLLIMVLFNVEIPSWFTFWWVVLLPYVFLKLFLRKTRLFKWFNTKIFKMD